MRYFTLFFLSLSLGLATAAQAQQPRPAPEPVGDFTLLIDSLTQNLNKAKVPAGILFDRAPGHSRLGTFTPTTASSGTHFQQSYMDLASAAYVRPAALLPHTQGQLTDLADAQLRAGRLPIGVLDARFGVLDTLSLNRGNIYESGGLYYEGYNTWTSAYYTRAAVVVSPLADTTGYTNTFTLPRSLLFQNTGRQLASLRVQVDNLTFTLLPGGSYTGTFYWGGTKTLYFTSTFSDGSTAASQARLYVRGTAQRSEDPFTLLAISPNIIGRPWTDYFGFTTFGEGQALRVLNHPDSKADGRLRNPIIVIDGFDPSDQRKMDGIIKAFRPLLIALGTAGRERDVVLLNLPTSNRPITYLGSTYTNDVDGGADFIERNALVLVELLDRLKPYMADPNQKVTVVGPSMGGLISRYGLALMEKNAAANPADTYWKHNVDTWISLDAPHGGANVPLGLQYFLKYFSGRSVPAFRNDRRLTSVAAQQMLVNHAADLNGDVFRKPFMRSLLDNGLPGSMGYPTKLRRVGMSNGYLSGKMNTNMGLPGESTIRLDVVRDGAPGSRSFFYRPTSPGAQVSADMYFSPAAGQSGVVFDGQARALVAAFKPILRRVQKRHTSNANGSYDLAPGDSFDSQRQVRDQTVNGPSPGEGYSYNFLIVKPTHSFIPTVSALAFDFRNTAAYDGTALLPNPYTNLAARQLGCGNETPFDAIFAEPTAPNAHVSATGPGADFLLRELYNVTQAAIFAPYTVSLCSNTTATLRLADCAGPTGLMTYNWSVTGPAVFTGSGSQLAANGGLSQTIRSTGPGQVGVSVIVRRPGASPSPATLALLQSVDAGGVRLETSSGGQEVCIYSTVTVTATPLAGAVVTGWRVVNGTLGSASGNQASVTVSGSPGSTMVYADFASSCPGTAGQPNTAEAYIPVVSSSGGFSCLSGSAFTLAGPQLAVFPVPADASLEIRSPFAVARPYRIEFFNDRGVLVYAEAARATSVRVDTRALPVGLYHLNLRQGNDVRRYNFSIQR